MSERIRIISRKSELALRQAEIVKNALLKISLELKIEIIGMTTSGDKLLGQPLAALGGKGLFVKELEHALLDTAADIAVHSMKDVPVQLPQGLCLTVICEREDARDVFISSKYKSLDEMPEGAVIGTSSLRRQSLVRILYPHLNIKILRGNVPTRLEKASKQEFDGIILAAAGLHRLNLQEHITHYLDVITFTPAIGQGAIGIECRTKDKNLRECLKKLNHPASKKCVTAERAFNEQMGGGCQVPLGAHAILKNNAIKLNAFVAYPDGSKIIKGSEEGEAEFAGEIGMSLAERLLKMGADKILHDVYKDYGR